MNSLDVICSRRKKTSILISSYPSLTERHCLNCFVSAEHIELEAIVSNLPSTLDHDWFGKELSPAIRYILTVDPTYLFFAASIPYAPGYSNSTAAMFTEELWKHDVAECFIKDDEGPGYQEFNIAPNGAWWTAHFNSYRKSNHSYTFNTDLVRVVSAAESSRWLAAIQFPRTQLGVKTEFGTRSKAAVSAIIGHDPRLFLTAATPSSKQPDFHALDHFLQIQPLKLPEELTKQPKQS